MWKALIFIALKRGRTREWLQSLTVSQSWISSHAKQTTISYIYSQNFLSIQFYELFFGWKKGLKIVEPNNKWQSIKGINKCHSILNLTDPTKSPNSMSSSAFLTETSKLFSTFSYAILSPISHNIWLTLLELRFLSFLIWRLFPIFSTN